MVPHQGDVSETPTELAGTAIVAEEFNPVTSHRPNAGSEILYIAPFNP